MAVGGNDETTERLRRAALRLFSQVGYGSATVDDIASEAGVGVATLYRRWPDKATLANDLFAETLDAMERLVPAELPATPKRAFLTAWTGLWEFARADPERFVFLEGLAHEAWISETNRRRKEAVAAGYGVLLDTVGVRADPALAQALVIGTLTAVLRSGDQVDSRELGERLWQALRAPVARA